MYTEKNKSVGISAAAINTQIARVFTTLTGCAIGDIIATRAADCGTSRFLTDRPYYSINANLNDAYLNIVPQFVESGDVAMLCAAHMPSATLSVKHVELARSCTWAEGIESINHPDASNYYSSFCDLRSELIAAFIKEDEGSITQFYTMSKTYPGVVPTIFVPGAVENTGWDVRMPAWARFHPGYLIKAHEYTRLDAFRARVVQAIPALDRPPVYFDRLPKMATQAHVRIRNTPRMCLATAIPTLKTSVPTSAANVFARSIPNAPPHVSVTSDLVKTAAPTVNTTIHNIAGAVDQTLNAGTPKTETGSMAAEDFGSQGKILIREFINSLTAEDLEGLLGQRRQDHNAADLNKHNPDAPSSHDDDSGQGTGDDGDTSSSEHDEETARNTARNRKPSPHPSGSKSAPRNPTGSSGSSAKFSKASFKPNLTHGDSKASLAQIQKQVKASTASGAGAKIDPSFIPGTKQYAN
jgi:hypothetical protein